MKKLAIVGAGAKAAAIVARAATLRAVGIAGVPEILVFEAVHPGAAWSGTGGYSSGFLTLCTPGEKDVGYPYDETASRGGHEPIASALFSRFSWSAFQVSEGNFSNWVDRGRNHPNHRTWARYLDWVLTSAGQPVTTAKVTAVRPRDAGGWELVYDEASTKRSVQVDGVVLTGTGRARNVPGLGSVPGTRVLDTETFWRDRGEILGAGADVTVAVAGDGGAAGAIVSWLVEKFAEGQGSIYSISPMGTLFPRGDGHAERRWFSDPTDWGELSLDHRRKLLERTEAGVISLRNKQAIDQSAAVDYRRGRVEDVSWRDTELELTLRYEGGAPTKLNADFLVCAIGFDNWSLLELLDDEASVSLRAADGGRRRAMVEEGILPDLSLPHASGLPAGLHVPALAGLAHGPGFGNLGCLGLMAAAILKPYLA